MGVPNQVVFTSSGTWTVPSGVVQARIQLCGGGGGGGGGGNAGYLAGGAGGGGAYCDFVASVTAVSSLNITIGAGGSGGASGNPNGANGTVGGATSISATGLNISAGGGGFGYGCGQASYRNTNVSGVGGSITLTTTTIVVNNSIITVSGSPGQQYRTDTGEVSGPNGGTSFFGGSGGGGINTSTNGSAFVGNAPADAYGGGGGGGRYVNNAGGAGAAGVVIITYFTQSGLPTNYTASAPLSMSGTTLSIANATTSSAGIVQVGSGLSVSSGNIRTVSSLSYVSGSWSVPSNSSSEQQLALAGTPVGSTIALSTSGSNTYWSVGAGTYMINVCGSMGASANAIYRMFLATGGTTSTMSAVANSMISLGISSTANPIFTCPVNISCVLSFATTSYISLHGVNLGASPNNYTTTGLNTNITLNTNTGIISIVQIA